MRILHALLFAAASAVVCRGAVDDTAWRGEGLVIEKDTISPNGRCAIVVRTGEPAMDKGEPDMNQLADVIEHRMLGKIAGTDHWANQNNVVLKA
jgi:hypothetical protein